MYSALPEQHWAFTSAFKAGILPLLEDSAEAADPELVIELAIAYLRRNFWQVSETLMQRAPQATHSIVARALMARARGELDTAGRLALLRGDPSRATAEFERYAEINPQDSDGWAQLAIAYEQAGQLESAARAQRNCGRVFYQGGIEALDTGDGSRAAELFAWALKLDPDYEPAKRALNRALEASGKSPGL
jgi:tetratricopeptide (TPR) repeat protein